MKEPRFSITISDLTYEDYLELLYCAEGAYAESHPVRKSTLRKIKVHESEFRAQHDAFWRHARNKKGRVTPK